MRVCKKCDKTLPNKCYYFDNKRQNFGVYCRDCVSIEAKRRYQEKKMGIFIRKPYPKTHRFSLRKHKTLGQKFWPKIQKENSCWIWIAAMASNNYGHLVHEGKDLYAHRGSWELHNGKIPNGLCALHKCDNPSCVNPKHLFLGTYKDNTQDMISKGRRGGSRHVHNLFV